MVGRVETGVWDRICMWTGQGPIGRDPVSDVGHPIQLQPAKDHTDIAGER